MKAIGIDLGTTNSEVAALVDGRVQVLGEANALMLPSVVGIDPQGELLIGVPARNQLLLYPERTIASVKRRMGSDEELALGDQRLRPEAVSSLILRRLVEIAERQLGERPERAVITVPAYFSDVQRQATREAGRLAGLEVLRILNEPTAASLAYGELGTALVYDLGGGTFDVSIVRSEQGVTEVLASHGDTRLGGDDIDALLADWLRQRFCETHSIQPTTLSLQAEHRLQAAAEQAKRRLSHERYTTVREEALASAGGLPLHLEAEVSREQLEQLARPLIERSLSSVDKALAAAELTPDQLDAVLLVGGSTRMPLVEESLAERLGQRPQLAVHPDLCVALGAAVSAARLDGAAVDRVLVDVSPYSYGPSYLGMLDGRQSPYCYRPIIRANTPLPVTRTESYWTSKPFQQRVDLEIYQGEHENAQHNLQIGQFSVVGLNPIPDSNEVLCRMRLDLDGILVVSAIEKATGLTREVRITGAFDAADDQRLDDDRRRLDALYQPGSGLAEPEQHSDEPQTTRSVELKLVPEPTAGADPAAAPASSPAQAALARSRALLPEMHEDDREEAIELNEALSEAINSGDADAIAEATAALEELLFFVEGDR